MGSAGLRAFDRQRLWQPVGLRAAADHDVHPAGRDPVSNWPGHQDDRRSRQLAGLGAGPTGAACRRIRHHPGFVVRRQHRHHCNAHADPGARDAGARLQQEDERRTSARKRRSRGDDAAQRARRHSGGDCQRISRQTADRDRDSRLRPRAVLRHLHRRRLHYRSECGTEIRREKTSAERTLDLDDQICRSAHRPYCCDDCGDLLRRGDADRGRLARHLCVFRVGGDLRPADLGGHARGDVFDAEDFSDGAGDPCRLSGLHAVAGLHRLGAKAGCCWRALCRFPRSGSLC